MLRAAIKPRGPFDACLPQRLIAGSIAGESQDSRGRRLLGALGVAIEQQEWHACTLQFRGCAAPHASIAANNKVVSQFLDHTLCAPLLQGIAELQFDDRLRHGANAHEDRRDADKDQERVEDPAGSAQWMDFVITDRRQRDQCHVEGIEWPIPLDQAEADGADGPRRHDREKNQQQAARQSAHGSGPDSVWPDWRAS
jgi:hypothetical protein